MLPGKGLAQHDFFYAGEQKQHQMFIVRKGHVVWSYIDSNSKGEISDAVRLSNGNILFAHQFGVTLIAPDKRVLWHIDAPKGAEIHTAQPIGTERVLYVQNGDPAFVRVVNIKTGATEREFNLPVRDAKGVHGHFRHARLTAVGTLLVAHMDMRKVVEYDSTGKAVWSYEIDSPWSAERLANGNTLIASNSRKVVEVDPQGKTAWELTPADMPEYKIFGYQIATRLPNGNTLVNNWFNSWSMTVDPANASAQAFEFTPDKKLVWVLRSWADPANLGPSTTIQLLDTKQYPERVHFGEIR